MSSRGIPEVLMKKVDEYVDSLAPQIQPRITSELEEFQQKTIDSLEAQVIGAFRSLFDTDKDSSKRSTGSPWDLDDNAPNAYGAQSLPFADEIAKFSRGFSDIADGAGDDLRDILNLSEGRNGQDQSRSRGVNQGDDSSRGARGFLSAALNAVQDHIGDNKPGAGGQGFELTGLLGVLSDTVRDASRNPEEKARLISPEIKEKVGAKLRVQHATIAEQFTRIALDHLKRWLRGNTSTRDLGDGVKGEFEDQVKDLVKGIGGLFGGKQQSKEGTSRGFDDRSRGDDPEENSGGFSKLISDKLSTGLGKVHREVRLEFRKVLGQIEKQLFELLPDEFQRPLEKLLGGNPFDSQLDRDAGAQADRGFGDDIKAKLVQKIRGLIQKVQETLRESILGVVNGGHRKFERESWVFVQSIVEQKVQRYLPNVKITVPDDIGNEGVSVGAPTANTQLGGGSQPGLNAHGNYAPPPSQHYDGQSGSPQRRHSPPQGGYNPPSSHGQDHGRPDYNRPAAQGDHYSAGSQGGYGGQARPQQDYGRPPSPGDRHEGQGRPQQSYGRPPSPGGRFKEHGRPQQSYGRPPSPGNRQESYGRPQCEQDHGRYEQDRPPQHQYQQDYNHQSGPQGGYRPDHNQPPSYQRPDNYRPNDGPRYDQDQQYQNPRY